MAGILVQLAITWLLAWLFYKKGLSVLGLQPTAGRLKDLLLFFFITAFFCAAGHLMKMYAGNIRWQLNPAISAKLVWEGIWWNIKSVLFEELIFRGVLLYILIRKTGAVKAIIISAIAFGIYHWFSFGVIGNPVQMAIVFFITGAMGLVLAYGYAKTFSLFIPIAIHFGWNLTQIFVFSQGPTGNGLFIPNPSTGFRTDSYFLFFVITMLPVLLTLLVNYRLIAKHPQQQPALPELNK